MNHMTYFTSNQDCTLKYLQTKENPYHLIDNWGQRLRKAMGEDILSRYNYHGGEFRPPTYRSMAETLDRTPWTCCNGESQMVMYILPYNDLYDGHTKNPTRHHGGIMVVCYSPYEYAYEFWNEYTQHYSPDLLDNATFGSWSELLPEPCSFVYENGKGILKWHANEPRVFRSLEMGRYQIPPEDCFVEVSGMSWRLARAEAYVQAWEKMASMEPKDKYKSFIEEDQRQLKEKWNAK